jgi:flagellin-specific chaperone FliS
MLFSINGKYQNNAEDKNHKEKTIMITKMIVRLEQGLTEALDYQQGKIPARKLDKAP